MGRHVFFCPNCGHQGLEGSQFCRGCGMDLEVAAEAVAGALAPAGETRIFGADRRVEDVVMRHYLSRKAIDTHSPATRALSTVCAYSLVLQVFGNAPHVFAQLLGEWVVIGLYGVVPAAMIVSAWRDQLHANRTKRETEEAEPGPYRSIAVPAHCVHCGAVSSPALRFCRACGTDLEAIGQALGGLLVPVDLRAEVTMRARGELMRAAAYGFVLLFFAPLAFGTLQPGILSFLAPLAGGTGLEVAAALAIKTLVVISAALQGKRALSRAIAWSRDPDAGLRALEAAGGVDVRTPVREPRPAESPGARPVPPTVRLGECRDAKAAPPSVVEHTTFWLEGPPAAETARDLGGPCGDWSEAPTRRFDAV